MASASRLVEIVGGPGELDLLAELMGYSKPGSKGLTLKLKDSLSGGLNGEFLCRLQSLGVEGENGSRSVRLLVKDFDGGWIFGVRGYYSGKTRTGQLSIPEIGNLDVDLEAIDIYRLGSGSPAILIFRQNERANEVVDKIRQATKKGRVSTDEREIRSAIDQHFDQDLNYQERLRGYLKEGQIVAVILDE